MSRSVSLYRFFVIALLLLLLDRIGLLTWVRGPADTVIVPVKTFLVGVNHGVSNAADVLLHYDQAKKIVEERERLRQEREELLFTNKKLSEENTELRNQLGAPMPAEFLYVPAFIIGIGRTMELAAGKADGIASGMPVVTGVNLIGRISEVSDHRSSVMLMTNPDIGVGGRTSRGTGGTVIGQAGDTVLLSKVLQKDLLFLDDQVVTSGEGNIPPNLIIGKIVHIAVSDVDVYKQAKIEVPYMINDLRRVFVIRGIKEGAK